MLLSKDGKEKKRLTKWKKEKDEIVRHFYSSEKVRKVAVKSLSELTDSSPSERPFTKKERVLADFSDKFTHFITSRNQLDMFPILISSNNPRLEKQDISRVKQFVYHIENYLSAIYIFEQRAKRLVNFLNKKGLELDCDPRLIKSLKDGMKDFSVSLKQINELRGGHVHDRPFSDKELILLEQIDLFAEYPTDPPDGKDYFAIRKLLLRFQRNKWKGIIRNNNLNCDAIMVFILRPTFKLLREIQLKTK